MQILLISILMLKLECTQSISQQCLCLLCWPERDMCVLQWSIPVPACLAPCIIPHVEEGEASEGVGDKVTHGDQITVNCSDNYEVSTTHTTRAGNEGPKEDS